MTSKQRDLLKNMVDNLFALCQNALHEFVTAASMREREDCATLSEIDERLVAIGCDLQDVHDLLDDVEVDDAVRV